MGTIIGWLMLKLGVGDKAARAIAYVSLALLLAGAFFGAKAIYDHGVIAKHDAKIEKKAAKAVDQAAGERATDTIAQAKNEQEAHDAIAAQPDQPIAPTSHALACQRLRKLGRTPPACR
jgi:hypothetical protein